MVKKLRTIWMKFRSLWHRPAVKREIDEELRFHLEQRTAENLAAGMAPEEAAREARRHFGNVQSIREECREVRGASFGEATWQDIRFGLRMLRKNPGFTAVVVFTVALGIGVNTAMFSILNTVLLRPLPYPRGDRLVVVDGTLSSVGAPQKTLLSAPDFLDLKQQTRVFESLAAYRWEGFDLTGNGEPLRLSGARVTADLFHVLGIRPLWGRPFSSAAETTGADRMVLIGHSLWQRRFGADTNLIGKAIVLTDIFHAPDSYTVVGIMPPGFDFPQRGNDKAEFWVPMAMDTEDAKDRGNRWMAQVLGRLKPGVGLAQAQVEMTMLASRLATAYPDSNQGWKINLTSLHEHTVRNGRLALLVLQAAVALVLLIACANAANLLLSRSLVREKEITIRSALGASRARVVRQLLVESLLLALLGGLVGGLLMLCCFKLMVAIVPADLPRVSELRMNGPVFGFTLAVSVATGVIFGLAPALQLSRPNLNLALAESSQRSSGSGRQSRLQGLLVVTEIALATVLLAGAGLLLQSLVHLRHVPLGFNPDQVLALGIQLPDGRYPNPAQQVAFFDDVLNRIATLPAVRSVGAIRELPIGANRSVVPLEVEGQPAPKPGDKTWASPVAVSQNYFPTMGIPLLKGRWFSAQDREGGPEVAMVNEAMARRFWPGEEALGKRFKMANSPWSWFTVVGIVKDARQVGEETQHLPEFFRPMAQFPNAWMTIVVKTTGDPLKSAALLRSQIWAVDKDLPIQSVRTLEQILSESVARPRFYASLVTTFAALALILTAVGVHGVMAYAVSRRTHEIGIRMALGADRSHVLKLVLKRGMMLVLAGVVLGTVGAVALTRYATSLLYGVKATDPLTFALVALLLTAVALLACLGPARRAARVAPMAALRYE